MLRYTHSGKSAAGFDLSGVIASEAKFAKTDFKEVVMSKAYARVSSKNALFGLLCREAVRCVCLGRLPTWINAV